MKFVVLALIGGAVGVYLLSSRPNAVERIVDPVIPRVEAPQQQPERLPDQLEQLPEQASNWLQFMQAVQAHRWTSNAVAAMVPRDCSVEKQKDVMIVRHLDNLISVSFKNGYSNTVNYYKVKRK